MLGHWTGRIGVGARFRLRPSHPLQRESLMFEPLHSTPLSPAPAITLVNARYKLWNLCQTRHCADGPRPGRNERAGTPPISTRGTTGGLSLCGMAIAF